MQRFGNFSEGNSAVDDVDSFLVDVEFNIFEAPVSRRVHSVNTHVAEFAFQPFFFPSLFAVFEPEQSDAETDMLRAELYCMAMDRIHIGCKQLECISYLSGLFEMLMAQLIQC